MSVRLGQSGRAASPVYPGIRPTRTIHKYEFPCFALECKRGGGREEENTQRNTRDNLDIQK